MFARLLSSPIQVITGGALMVMLIDVLGCKCTVDFTNPTAPVNVLHPHPHGCLWPC